MFSPAGMTTGKSKETLSHDVPDSGRCKYFVCISILDNYLVTKIISSSKIFMLLSINCIYHSCLKLFLEFFRIWDSNSLVKC